MGHPGIGGGGSQKWWNTAGKLWKNGGFARKNYGKIVVLPGEIWKIVVLPSNNGDSWGFIGGISPRKMMF